MHNFKIKNLSKVGIVFIHLRIPNKIINNLMKMIYLMKN